MRAMVIERPGRPLAERELADPEPGEGQALLEVRACGVCRTDLHLIDGEVEIPSPPVVPGHQIVGEVRRSAGRFEPGTLVGVPWLGWTCGECRYCASGRENLCPRARFTGRDIDGGYAELTVADERFCFPIPDGYPYDQAAPLLCAGLIGLRALRLAGEALDVAGGVPRLGMYGFGAAAHIVTQVARHEGARVFAFTRAGDEPAQAFARELGCEWAGGSDEPPPQQLDAALIFAAAGELVPAALSALAPGGAVVCGGIHMSDIPSFPYETLWHERSVRSVANLTRRDGEEFMALAPQVPVRTQVTRYPLGRANDALEDLRAGAFSGAAVIDVTSGG